MTPAMKKSTASRPRASQSPTYYSCYECGARFPSLQALGGHKSVHSPKRRTEKLPHNISQPSNKRLKASSPEPAVASPLAQASIMFPPWAAFLSVSPFPMISPPSGPLGLDPWVGPTMQPAHQPQQNLASFTSSPSALLHPAQLRYGPPGLPPMSWCSSVDVRGLPIPALNKPTRHLVPGSYAPELRFDHSAHLTQLVPAMQPADSAQSIPSRVVAEETTPQELGAHNSPAFAKLLFEEAALKLRTLGRRATLSASSLSRVASDASSEASALSRSSLVPASGALPGNPPQPSSASLSASRLAPAQAAAKPRLPALLPSDGTSREQWFDAECWSPVQTEAGDENKYEERAQEGMGKEGEAAEYCLDSQPQSAWKPWTRKDSTRGSVRATTPTMMSPDGTTRVEMDLSLKLGL